MGAQKLQTNPAPEETAVLTKAVTRAAGLLGLTQRQVAETLGLSGPRRPGCSPASTGCHRPGPRNGSWPMLFVRLFRSLDALWGHEGTARAWLEGYNTALGAAPLELIKSAAGLVRVVDYLDHARGRV
jgi:hypothetical protein